jgi:hypothetical protein
LALPPSAEIPRLSEGMRCAATVPVAFTSGVAERVRAGRSAMSAEMQP